MTRIIMGSHTGTHLDAPRHFIRDGIGIDRIPPNKLIGEAYVADLSKKGPVTLKLRESHYFGDDGLEGGDLPSITGIRELELVARDAYDHHAIARASCAVNAQGDVVELR